MAQLGLDLAKALAGDRLAEPKAISCFVELDLATAPTPSGLGSRLTPLVTAARRAAEEACEDHATTTNVRADVDRIAHFLADDFDGGGSKGLALFVCEDIGRWDEVLLPGAVGSAVHIGRTFVLGPLLEFLERD